MLKIIKFFLFFPGAIIVALGAGAAGVFSNDDDLWKIIEKVFYSSVSLFNDCVLI